MLKKVVTIIVFSFGFLFHPALATADEVTQVVNDVAAKLVQQLPMDKKIALKSLSPKETGLPEDFLRKLTSDLEAALLNASDFEINLANRLSMEEVWQEAIEFNNANFDELFKNANADVMLMMSPRAISTGVEIAITAYSLTGDNVGKTIASSGSVLLPIDLQANLGVDVIDLNDQVNQVLKEIEKISSTGGLVSQPKTYAEFYHNARLLQQRGENDLAISNYTEALKQDQNFVDPLVDLISLVKTRYKARAARGYIEKRVKPLVSENLRQMIDVYLMLDDNQIVNQINENLITFPPAMAWWLQTSAKRLKLVRDGDIPFVEKAKIDSALLKSVRRVRRSLEQNEFADFFIDDIKSLEFADIFDAEALEQELNVGYVHRVAFEHEYRQSATRNFVSILCTGIGFEYFEFSKDGTPLEYREHNISENEKNALNDLIGWKCPSAVAVNLNFRMDGKIKSYLRSSDFWYDAEGFSGAPCRLGGQLEIKNSIDGDPIEGSLRDLQEELLYDNRFLPLLNNIERLSYSGPELSFLTTIYGPSTKDYAIYADPCLEYLGAPDKPGELYAIPYLGGLTITDEVDINEPILVFYQEYYGDGSVDPSDITQDGTYLSPLGPTIGGGNGDWGYSYNRVNNWLFAPGLLQSSIMQNRIEKIVYTNMLGEAVTLTNIEYVDDETFVTGGVSTLEVSETFEGRELYELPDLVAAQFDRYQDLGKRQCYIESQYAEIANVNQFTNLRQQAGLGGRVIAQVPLTDRVKISNPGSYLRTNRCASPCESNNQALIDQCIENNEVWIEVQYNGRRGFLSRKFLE